jgi:acid stress chaperone HdeB
MRRLRGHAGANTMKTILLILTIALTLPAAPARAERLDLATMRCKEFLDSGKENTGLILMWLQGYYSEADAAPVVDFDKMKADGGKIGEYCRKYAGHSLITAAEKVMVKE